MAAAKIHLLSKVAKCCYEWLRLLEVISWCPSCFFCCLPDTILRFFRRDTHFWAAWMNKVFSIQKILIDLAMKNCLQCSMDIHPCVESEIEKRDFLQHYYWHVCCIPYLHFSFWDIPEFSIIDWRHIPMPCLKFKNTFFPMHDACLLWSLQKRKCAILGFYDLNKTDGLENLRLWAFRPCELR